MKALVLWHEPDGPSGEVGERLRQRGFDLVDHVITEVYEEPQLTTGPLPPFGDHDLVVIMGSVRSLTRKSEVDSWIYGELEQISSAYDAGVPILGVCFGGQLLAEALGGVVEAAPRSEIGWFQIEPVEGSDCPVEPGPWMQWHHDRFTAPPEAEVMAKSAVGQQLFRVGRSVGTQFHPEITNEILDGWLSTSDEDYLAEHRIDPDRLREETAANQLRSAERCHRLVDWFLDTVAFPAGLPK